MSKPRYRWWGFVRRMIRDYRGLKAAWEELHCQSMTANMSSAPSGGGTGRAVESIAMRELPPDDQKAYDAVTRAIKITALLPDGAERLGLIGYIYWCQDEHQVKDASLQAHVSVPTAKRWHGDFVRLVGKCYGFSLKDDTPEPKESAILIP